MNDEAHAEANAEQVRVLREALASAEEGEEEPTPDGAEEPEEPIFPG